MTTPSHFDERAAERFARALTARLSAGEADLPYVVTERLRASREQALAQRKRALSPLRVEQHALAPSHHLNHDGTLSAGGGDGTPLWLRRLLTALPLLALAAGLVMISADQDARSTLDVAELDAALLTSELPPAAFTDAGFQQFLQSTETHTP